MWRAIAPLMKPWCAEVEVPTAANLNLYRGGNSCVGWHRDDEPLFGESGEAKLIVSVSLGGSAAVFRWRRRSCPDDEGQLCCLGQGDILVMDRQCQDEFLHCTDPGLGQERIHVTFRWIKRHIASCASRTGVVCCLPTRVHLLLLGGVLGVVHFGHSGCSLESCAYGGCWRCWFFPSCPQDSGYGSVPLAGHALWAEVGGGITIVTFGENAWQLIKLLNVFMGLTVVSWEESRTC